MSHTIVLTDEAYQLLSSLALSHGQTPEALIERLIVQHAQEPSERNPRTDPRYLAPDEFLSHLGMSNEMIRKAEELAARDTGDQDADI